MTSTDPRTSRDHGLKNGFLAAWSIMIAQAPFVNALNRISVISCQHDLRMMLAIHRIYQGTIDHSPPSPLHFLKGGKAHLVKEHLRLSFKGFGLLGKPEMDKYFGDSTSGKMKSDGSLALITTLGEMAIQPADTLRTMRHGAKHFFEVEQRKRWTHLYKGAGANGLTQFGIWVGYPHSERLWSRIVEERTSLDPHGLAGITIKALPQSFQITTPIWLFQRLKNELQYRPELEGKSRYMTAFKEIMNSQGPRGFLRGYIPRVWSNTILIIGANCLLEKGRARLSSKT